MENSMVLWPKGWGWLAAALTLHKTINVLVQIMNNTDAVLVAGGDGTLQEAVTGTRQTVHLYDYFKSLSWEVWGYVKKLFFCLRKNFVLIETEIFILLSI